jgi:hypothetical protein
MDFMVRTLPFGRQPADGAIGDIGCEAASDEGAYQTSPPLGKPPPPWFRPYLDPSQGGFQGTIVEFVIEAGNTLGEMAVHPALAEFVGQPTPAPSTVYRTELDKPLGQTRIIEEVELVEALEGGFDVAIVKALAAELLGKLGAEVVAPGDELEGLVVGRIFHNYEL